MSQLALEPWYLHAPRGLRPRVPPTTAASHGSISGWPRIMASLACFCTLHGCRHATRHRARGSTWRIRFRATSRISSRDFPRDGWRFEWALPVRLRHADPAISHSCYSNLQLTQGLLRSYTCINAHNCVVSATPRPPWAFNCTQPPAGNGAVRDARAAATWCRRGRALSAGSR